jgi:hypothetical protein
MADIEKIHVKLGISGTYWSKRPAYRVLFNDQVIKEAVVTGESDQVEFVEFDTEYTTDSATLKVQLLNKEDSDTVQSARESSIVKDMLLNIVSLEIDEIDLGQIIYEDSEYLTDYQVDFNGGFTTSVRNCVNLGWNGTWSLTWNNPFYIWLLEKI